MTAAATGGVPFSLTDHRLPRGLVRELIDAAEAGNGDASVLRAADEIVEHAAAQGWSLDHGEVLIAAADAVATRRAVASANGAAREHAPAPPTNPWSIDRTQCMQAAREALAPSLAERKAPAYPVEALGPLAPACRAIAEAGQVEPAMAGQTLLGAASLLAQGLHNVETLAGQRPLSLYLLTLGDSGDGKSTAQRAALAPVTDWQRKQTKTYRAAQAVYESDRARRKKGEEPPRPPQCPYRLAHDATVEGLRRDLEVGVCSQGVFTDEAAAVLSGYGMSPEQRAKTASVFSRLWDDGHLSVSRAIGGRVERYGRRVALHWLIQPMAAAETVADPLLSALGFWPRYLAAWPAPQAPRKAREFAPEKLSEVGAYWQRCAELLAVPLPDDATDAPALPLSSEARRTLSAAFERFEREARRGELRDVRPFALRACEQGCRVAGVLAAFGGEAEVSDTTMRGALALVAYSLDTWRTLLVEAAADPRGSDALRLYEWLLTRPQWREPLAAIVRLGPACVRSRDRRNAALDLLAAAGLVEVADGHALALPAPSLRDGT